MFHSSKFYIVRGVKSAAADRRFVRCFNFWNCKKLPRTQTRQSHVLSCEVYLTVYNVPAKDLARKNNPFPPVNRSFAQ